MTDDKKSEIERALYKRAIGYDATETVEEFSDMDGEVKLVKKKVTVKNVPPDISAAKMLFDMEGKDELSCLSDEELEKEKKRLLKLLKEIKKNGGKRV